MGRGRISSWTGVVCALLAAVATAGVAAGGWAQTRAPASGRTGVHEGVATCGGSTCHGRPAPSGLVVRQNELITWQEPRGDAGAHSRAWRVLTQPRAEAIATRLGIGRAETAPACLSCHADPAPAGQRGPRF